MRTLVRCQDRNAQVWLEVQPDLRLPPPSCHLEPQRGPLEPERAPDLVVQIAFVGEVQIDGAVHRQGERWGCGADLARVEDTHRAVATVRLWGLTLHGSTEHPIERARRHTLAAGGVRPSDRGEEGFEPPPRARGHEDDRRPSQEAEALPDLALERG